MSFPWKLEFSASALSVSNAAAVRTDISSLVKTGTLRWAAGIRRLGDEPRAGEMTFTLLGRDFEPLYAGSPHHPNVVRRRRFFLSFDRGAGFVDEFVGYARTIEPVWPGNVTHQEVEVVCGDGFDVLVSDRLPTLDPPQASSYPDVVMFDMPFWYGRLGEPSGTTAEAVAGARGSYRNGPSLNETGVILGDRDRQVEFDQDVADHFVRIPLDAQNRFADTNRLTLECWFTPRALALTQGSYLMLGPFNTPTTKHTFTLLVTSAGGVLGEIRTNEGHIPTVVVQGLLTADTPIHLVLTWDGQVLRLYADGVLVGTDFEPGSTLRTGDASGFLYIGGSDLIGLSSYGLIDEPAFYEHALTPERIRAHYQAGTARGYAGERAGNRIQDAATHTLWDESGIPASVFRVQPRMKTGQSPLDVIEEALAAEGAQAMFFFDNAGDPVYLGWEWKASGSFMTPQATFGAPHEAAEIHFDTEQLRYDDEIYNEATLARDDGEAVIVVDTASQAAFERSVHEPITGLSNADDADVERLGGELLALYAEPTWALDRLDLHGSDGDEEAQIFALGIGSLIRYKRRSVDENTGAVGNAVDVVTHILGYEKRLGAGQVVACTFHLARGFNAAAGVWRAGITGFSEAGSTTVAA